jgi:hypothetical protein
MLLVVNVSALMKGNGNTSPNWGRSAWPVWMQKEVSRRQKQLTRIKKKKEPVYTEVESSLLAQLWALLRCGLRGLAKDSCAG